MQRIEADQKMKWAMLGGVAVGLVTGGLGALASMAVFGATGAVTTGVSVASGLAGSQVAQLVGELGRRAVMGATKGALQVGSAMLVEAGPQLAAQAIAATVEKDD